jgi:hypothetical protein
MVRTVQDYFKDENSNCTIVGSKCDKDSCTECKFATAGIVRQDINEIIEVLGLVERSVGDFSK